MRKQQGLCSNNVSALLEQWQRLFDFCILRLLIGQGKEHDSVQVIHKDHRLKASFFGSP